MSKKPNAAQPDSIVVELSIDEAQFLINALNAINPGGTPGDRVQYWQSVGRIQDKIATAAEKNQS